MAQTAELARLLARRGCDHVHVSSGLSPETRIPAGPGYRVGFARTVREASRIATIAVGQIAAPFQAEQILRSGQADMVALACPMPFDPRWAWKAARALGREATYPPQYERAHPSFWRG